MAFKTLTIDEEAYARLKAAKESARESFSKVILRSVPPPPARNAGELLQRLSEFEGVGLLAPVARAELKRAKRNAKRSSRRR